MPPQSDGFTIGDYQLNGQLEHLTKSDGRQQVFHFRSGGFKAKQIVNLWLEHLFACAIRERMGNSIGLGIDKEGAVEKCEFVPLEKSAAQQYLLELIEFMNICYTQPQPFFLSLAFSYLTAETEKKEGILNQASDSEFSQLNDEFVQRCFSQIIEEDEFQFLTEQTALWQSLLQPLLDHMVTDRDDEADDESAKTRGGK